MSQSRANPHWLHCISCRVCLSDNRLTDLFNDFNGLSWFLPLRDSTCPHIYYICCQPVTHNYISSYISNPWHNYITSFIDSIASQPRSTNDCILQLMCCIGLLCHTEAHWAPFDLARYPRSYFSMFQFDPCLFSLCSLLCLFSHSRVTKCKPRTHFFVDLQSKLCNARAHRAGVFIYPIVRDRSALLT